jgi:hypothetical protein
MTCCHQKLRREIFCKIVSINIKVKLKSLRNSVEDNEVKLCKKNQVAGFASY